MVVILMITVTIFLLLWTEIIIDDIDSSNSMVMMMIIQACQLGKPKKEENYSLMPVSDTPPSPARSLKRASPCTNANKHINRQNNNKTDSSIVF